MGVVLFLQASPKRKAPAVVTESLELVVNLGVVGDYHAREGSLRQVLLMDEANLLAFDLAPGIVKENILTRGIPLHDLPQGTRVEVGEALVEITMDCEPCPLMDAIRPGLEEALKGKRGMLARVLRSGTVRVGDAVQVEPSGAGKEETHPPASGRAALH